ncbi:hypothetical protein NDU88_006204 [Pleurodeles waltl]|uniref:Uncharacterized protein n=1 Tax=Pleurodeles waltl TaxID=8319 RepID=A0AAV7TWJ1_PLEWA|nr:hypothetical protein NDU88_006204 [Pleurodeles waltl]
MKKLKPPLLTASVAPGSGRSSNGGRLRSEHNNSSSGLRTESQYLPLARLILIVLPRLPLAQREGSGAARFPETAQENDFLSPKA